MVKLLFSGAAEHRPWRALVAEPGGAGARAHGAQHAGRAARAHAAHHHRGQGRGRRYRRKEKGITQQKRCKLYKKETKSVVLNIEFLKSTR